MHGFNPEFELMILRRRHADLRRHAHISKEFREAQGRRRFRSRHRRKRTSP